MVSGLSKCGIGVFSDHEATELALEQLKEAAFDLNHVSVVVRQADQNDEMTKSESELIRQKTVQGLVKGGLTVGTLGSLVGILAGLATLALPGVGGVAIVGAKVAMAGMLAGGYYGTAAGGILGAIWGNGVSREQARIYSDHLAQGHYLVIVDGTEDELQHAEAVLQTQGAQDWGIYQTT